MTTNQRKAKQRKPAQLTYREIGEQAICYMAESMAMREPLTDQEQNWTLRHLQSFAAFMCARDRRLRKAAR